MVSVDSNVEAEVIVEEALIKVAFAVYQKQH